MVIVLRPQIRDVTVTLRTGLCYFKAIKSIDSSQRASMECVLERLSRVTKTWGWRRGWRTARSRWWSIRPCQCQTDETTTSASATINTTLHVHLHYY